MLIPNSNGYYDICAELIVLEVIELLHGLCIDLTHLMLGSAQTSLALFSLTR